MVIIQVLWVRFATLVDLTTVETAEGRGSVIEVNLLTGVLKVKLDKKPDVPLVVKKEEVKLLKDGKIQLNRDELNALKNLEGK